MDLNLDGFRKLIFESTIIKAQMAVLELAMMGDITTTAAEVINKQLQLIEDNVQKELQIIEFKSQKENV
jgi:hypothetical protein